MPDALVPSSTVSAAEISRNFGEWQSRAMASPVAITHHGRIRLVLASLADYTSRSASEPSTSNSLQTTGAQVSALTSQMPGGFIAYDANFLVTSANAHSELFLSLSESQMLGRDLRDLRPETADSMVWSYLSRVRKTHEAISCTIISTLHDRQTLDIRAFPYADGVAVIYNSVRAEHFLAQSESKSRALASAISLDRGSAVIELDVRGCIVGADTAFNNMTGFTASQLSNLQMIQITPPTGRRALSETINLIFAEGKPRCHTGTIMTRNGDERRLRFNMGPIDLDGAVTGIMVLVLEDDGQEPVWSGP